MENNTIKKIDDVYVDAGMVALLKEEGQQYWTKYQTGSIQYVTFHGKDQDKINELCYRKGYYFLRENGRYTLRVKNEQQANEVISFIESQQPRYWVKIHNLYNNSYDRILTEFKKHEKPSFVHDIQPLKTNEKAYIICANDGYYHLYETNRGLECWIDGNPFDEDDLEKIQVLETLRLTEPTEFCFSDPGDLHEESHSTFLVPKGTYQVEVGLDGNYQACMLRLVRTDAPYISYDVHSHLEKVQAFLDEKGIRMTPENIEDLIQLIEEE